MRGDEPANYFLLGPPLAPACRLEQFSRSKGYPDRRGPLGMCILHTAIITHLTV